MEYSTSTLVENKFFECPVTHEIFKNPRVLPCGHTCDLESLTGLTKCPLCSSKIGSAIPSVNWLVANMLGLSIPVISERFNKKVASKQARDVMEPIYHKEIERIKVSIDDASRQGAQSLQYLPSRRFWKYKHCIRKQINSVVITSMENLGFSVYSLSNYSWCNDEKYVKISWA